MSREKVSFQANVPVEVALEYPEGKFVEGQFGDQYQFSLTGNRIMWVPPVVHKQIVELGIQPGELIIICKSVTKEGRASVTRWMVRRAETAGQLAVPRVKEPERAACVQNAPAPAARVVERPVSEAANGLPHDAISFLSPARLDRMTRLLVDAINAVKAAAAQTGTPINAQFDSAQFQDMVVTVVINEQRAEELRYKYAGSLPPARPNGATQWNGRAQ